jgi:nucleoid DNA-binding protein
MRLESFICELLYEHDCVVLPEFGGLVANYRSARLNRRTHVILPPSKHIGFNRNLRSNDGLLCSHVAAVAGISYKEASAKLDEVIGSYQKQLQENGRLVLDKIGVFFNDKSGQIQFIPDEQENFLLSSYGLGPVQLKFVEQEVEKEETPLIPITDHRRSMSGWKIAAAIAIPLLLAGSLLVNNQLKHSGNFNFASLNPFHKTNITSVYEPTTLTYTPRLDETTSSLKDVLKESEGNVKYDFVSGVVSSDGIEIENIRPIAKPVTTEVKKDTEPIRDAIKHEERSGSFALIGGAFQIEENAQNFLNKLKQDGFDAAFAGKKDGLQLVAYGFYSSRAEAARALKSIQVSGGHAWIRKGGN